MSSFPLLRHFCFLKHAIVVGVYLPPRYITGLRVSGLKQQHSALFFSQSAINNTNHRTTLDMSSNDASSAPNTSNTEELLGLPSASASNESINTTARLEALGPVVVNEDGSISRINNWKEMTENERKILERVLLKRNAQRLALLRGQDTNNTENNKDNQ